MYAYYITPNTIEQEACFAEQSQLVSHTNQLALRSHHSTINTSNTLIVDTSNPILN